MTLEIFILITTMAAIQASFQLSVSMMTVMSGHALSKKTANRRLLSLLSSFTLGAMTMIALVLSFVAVIYTNVVPEMTPALWSALSGLMAGIGVAVWLFYYRHKTAGTVLWIPRPMAKYLSDRAKATKITPEAYGLGLVSVVAEIVFSVAPILVTAALLINLDTPVQLAGLLLYTVLASLPLFVIVVLLGSGHSLARIQRWREQNKRFLQFIAGSALIVVGVYLYVTMVVSPLSMGVEL